MMWLKPEVVVSPPPACAPAPVAVCVAQSSRLSMWLYSARVQGWLSEKVIIEYLDLYMKLNQELNNVYSG